MKVSTLGLHVNLDHLLGIIPSATCISHKHGLEEAKDGDGDEVGNEEADGVLATNALGRREAGESQSEAEDGDKDVNHAALGIFGADFNHILALPGVGLLGGVSVEFDVTLDILHSTVGTGSDGLHGGTGEPVNDASAEDESKNAVGVEQVEDRGGFDTEGLLNHQDEGEDHSGGTHHGGTDKDGLGGGFEGVACTVVGLEVVFGLLEVGLEAELLLHFLGGLLHIVLDEGELVDALGVVGHRTVGINSDGDRTHTEHTESHKAKGKDGGILREDAGEVDVEEDSGEVGNKHQHEENKTCPEGTHVAGHKTAEDIERRTTLLGGRDNLMDVLRFGRGEHLGQFGDKGSTEGTARNDDRKSQPGEAGKVGSEHEIAGAEGAGNAEDGGNPYKAGQRLLEIEIVGLTVANLGDCTIDVVGQHGSHDTEDTHNENPDKQWHLILDRNGEEDKAHEGYTGNAIGLETVGGGSDGVTGIVASAVGDNTGVARVVLANLEDNLHEVASDIGNLGEDTASDTQSGCTEALTNSESDEARASKVLGHQEQDDEHKHQLDADKHDTDAHTGAQRDVEQIERTATEAGKSHTGIGEGVHTHTEPGHTVASEDTDNGPSEDEHNTSDRHTLQHSEIEGHCSTNEEEEEQEELALLLEVGGAGLEDNIADFKHRLVGLELAHLAELPEAK